MSHFRIKTRVTSIDPVALLTQMREDIETRQEATSRLEIKLALASALSALRAARPTNGDSARHITAARRQIKEALKAA